MLVMPQRMTQDACAMRVCSKCGASKPLTLEHFQADAQKSSGYRPDCKECRHAGYARKRPESRRLENSRLVASGSKRCCACSEIKPFSAFYPRDGCLGGVAERCRECKADYVRARRASDPEKFDAPAKAYKRRNQDKVRERARIYAARRRAEDPRFRLRGAISRLVGCFLKRRGHSKAGRGFFAAVGYTVEQLVEHVERQFLPGMTWANYGEWHLDHILPNASFEYTSMDGPEFRACWSLPNLRPLWRLENLRKGAGRVTLL